MTHTAAARVLSLAALAAGLALANTDDETACTRRLAEELDARGEHAAAAVEYRRLAVAEPDGDRRAGYRWAAAYEYRLAGKHDLAARMLDRAEQDGARLSPGHLLLRADTAASLGAPDEASFYLDSLLAEAQPAEDNALRTLATRRLAQAKLSARDVEGARQALRSAPDGGEAALAAVDRYARRRDRVPWLGGVLGLIPGLGHAYSGEYANAARCLLLNGLFLYGMAHTAQREEWGAFAAIGFFELTWYTGSIYGGVDAAERHNRDALNACLDDVGGGAGFSPDLTRIPLVSLHIEL